MSISSCRSVSIPPTWRGSVKAAVLSVISLAQYAITYTRGWAADSCNARVRLQAQLDQAKQEIALLREELRIKDARMRRIDPQRRPHYPPVERLAILELKAARCWSLEQTAKAFLLAAATISAWMRRLDDDGPEALVQTSMPVNRFPDFVRYVVQRLKTLCPTMGKLKIAQTLARAGLHLGATTIGRALKESPRARPAPPPRLTEQFEEARVVTAKYPNHVWHVDLTVVPTMLGFWCSWLPCALVQRWPFAWWLAVAEDHYSRRAVGQMVYYKQPSSAQVCAMLGRAIAAAGRAPRYVVCDRGGQFDCDGFRRWCRRKGIKRPRYGAIHKHGSIAVVERLILTIKTLLHCLCVVPLRHDAMRREVCAVVDWYNEHRPHTTLGGRTPNEVYFDRFPANRRPRHEPRDHWPRGSPCARPWALVRGKAGARLELEVEFAGRRRHLPIVRVRRVA